MKVIVDDRLIDLPQAGPFSMVRLRECIERIVEYSLEGASIVVDGVPVTLERGCAKPDSVVEFWNHEKGKGSQKVQR